MEGILRNWGDIILKKKNKMTQTNLFSTPCIHPLTSKSKLLKTAPGNNQGKIHLLINSIIIY